MPDTTPAPAPSADQPVSPGTTVRVRKQDPKASTQRFLPIAEIRNDTVMLKNGGLRAVLQVEAVNFNLKSETEQQGIIAGYGAFLNTVTFPLQIVIRSMRTNIDGYIATLQTLEEKQQNALLKSQTESYIAFIQRLLDMADIMQKRFYVVVPFDHVATKKTMFSQFLDWISPDDSSGKANERIHGFASASKSLTERVELVAAGLNNVGLHSNRLNTRELLSLYYEIYNPKTSQHQKIPADLDKLNLEKGTI